MFLDRKNNLALASDFLAITDKNFDATAVDGPFDGIACLSDKERREQNRILSTDWSSELNLDKMQEYFFVRARLPAKAKWEIDKRIIAASLKKGDYSSLAVDAIFDHFSGNTLINIEIIRNDKYFSCLDIHCLLLLVRWFTIQFETSKETCEKSQVYFDDTPYRVAFSTLSILIALRLSENLIE